ncbi:MAG: transglutaminase domain-containing protein [Janthinobacterium lividum]
MKCILAILLSLLSYNVHADRGVDSVRYVYAKRAQQNLALVPLVNYLKIGAVNNQKIVETFFYWIALNIKYDKEIMLKQDRTNQDVSVDVILTKKKTICAGYSNLLYEMCTLAKVECAVINGFTQTMWDGNIGVSHAWNAVKLNSKWYLVDATWGSGGYGFGSDDDEYIEKLDMRYFLAEPNFLIIDHFPNEAEWQLLPKAISLIEFHNEYWDEMRFRKSNDLLDDAWYKEYKKREREATQH